MLKTLPRRRSQPSTDNTLVINLDPVLPKFLSSPHVSWHVTASAESTVPWQDHDPSKGQTREDSSCVERGVYLFKKSLRNGTLWGCPDFEVEEVTTRDGTYVGDYKFGEYLIELGIVAEKADPQHTVCSVGFCESTQKWAGWSHRAMSMFGIGDRVFDASFGDENTLFTEHGATTISTLSQAREAAVNFANYVS